MKGMIKVGRWANEHKHAAAAILDKQTFYLDVEDTYEGIKHIDMVPNLSPQNLGSVEIGKDFMVSHDYIKNDFDVHEWAAPEFLEQAAKELINESWEKVTGDKLPTASTCYSGSRERHLRSSFKSHEQMEVEMLTAYELDEIIKVDEKLCALPAVVASGLVQVA